MNNEGWVNYPDIHEHEADLFYIYPTLIGTGNDFMDIDDPSIRKIIFDHKDQYLEMFDGADLYMPFYRQVSSVVFFRYVEKAVELFWKGELTYESVTGILKTVWEQFFEQAPYSDITNSFSCYLDNKNDGRPIVLVGKSQGSIMLQLLLNWIKVNRPEVLKQIVAAYIVGWPVCQKYCDAVGLKFAESRTDTGVILSWNTQKPDCYFNPFVLLIPDNLSINPINWKRDTTYASKQESLGSVLNTDQGRISVPNFADAQIIRPAGFQINNGAIKSDIDNTYIIGSEFAFLPGVLHNLDYDLFYQDVRQNIKDRIASFLDKTSI